MFALNVFHFVTYAFSGFEYQLVVSRFDTLAKVQFRIPCF